MDNLALKISLAIKRSNPDETVSVEVMQYALGIILNTLITFICSILIGLLLHQWTATLLFYICFSLLRICSGGFHLKTALACNIVTTLLCTVTPFAFHPTGSVLLVINIFSLLIMLLFAPNPDSNTHIPLRWFPALKLTSIAFLGLSFLIGSSVIGLAFFVQSLTVIPWKGGFSR